MYKEVITSSPGKIILFGEHAVVYDRLGIASTIDLRSHILVKFGESRITSKSFNQAWKYSEEELKNILLKFERLKQKKNFDKIKELNKPEVPIKFILAKIFDKSNYKSINIKIESKIRKGLGSSSSIFSALALSIYKLLNKEISKKEISQLTYEGDIIAHGGTPSGIDNNVVTFGGYVKFTKSEGIKKLKINLGIPLLVVDSGRPATTANTVTRVRKLRDRKSKFVDQILDKINNVSLSAIDELKATNLEKLGKLMNINHELLKQLKVSTTDLDKLVNLALKNGAYGAKLIGGGGGGCIIILAENSEKLKNIFEKNGYKSFVTKLGVEGVRVES